MPHLPRAANPMVGVHVAIVTSHADPEKAGRVRVQYPWLHEENESGWARVASPHAGDSRGMYFIPETGDEVLVAFEDGDPCRPVIIGSLWSGKDHLPCPPAEDNGRKSIRTRSGLRIEWEESGDAERLSLQDSSGAILIEIDGASGELRLYAREGNIRIDAPEGEVAIRCKSLSIDCGGDLRASVGGDLSMKIDRDAELTCRGDLAGTARGSIDFSGGTVCARARSGARIQGSNLQLQADGEIVQRAPLIRIN